MTQKETTYKVSNHIIKIPEWVYDYTPECSCGKDPSRFFYKCNANSICLSQFYKHVFEMEKSKELREKAYQLWKEAWQKVYSTSYSQKYLTEQNIRKYQLVADLPIRIED